MVHDFIHGQEPSLLSRVTFKLKIRSRGYEKILPSLIKIHETKRLNYEKKKSLNHASCKKYMTLLDNSLYFLTLLTPPSTSPNIAISGVSSVQIVIGRNIFGQKSPGARFLTSSVPLAMADGLKQRENLYKLMIR